MGSEREKNTIILLRVLMKIFPAVFTGYLVTVGNLPNELPRDASRYFGEQLIKYILKDLLQGGSPVIENATIVKQGKLTNRYEYLKRFAAQ